MPDTYTPGQNAPKKGMSKKGKTWLLIGGFGVAGIVVWYVVKNRSASSTSATGTTDPSIDPATGIPYAQEMGGAYAGGMGTTPSLYGYVDPNTGQFISGVGSGNTVLAPSTNASWAQQVEAYLQNLGYDPTAVAAAIGKYLTGQALTADQSGIVAAAQGFFGNPPQGAPVPVTSPPGGQGGGGGTGTGGGSTKTLTVGRRQTLAEMAKNYHWTAATLAAIEKLNNLTAKSELKKGQKLIRPIA
jgi:hypothetical protein